MHLLRLRRRRKRLYCSTLRSTTQFTLCVGRYQPNIDTSDLTSLIANNPFGDSSFRGRSARLYRGAHTKMGVIFLLFVSYVSPNGYCISDRVVSPTPPEGDRDEIASTPPAQFARVRAQSRFSVMGLGYVLIQKIKSRCARATGHGLRTKRIPVTSQECTPERVCRRLAVAAWGASKLVLSPDLSKTEKNRHYCFY